MKLGLPKLVGIFFSGKSHTIIENVNYHFFTQAFRPHYNVLLMSFNVVSKIVALKIQEYLLIFNVPLPHPFD